MLTGLSIPTLRHYDDIGLLPPAKVDVQTGYRRYSSAQVDTGRRVRLLREAELSTEDIARMLNGDTSAAREVLARQRAALSERAARVEALLDQLTHDNIEGTATQMKTAADFRLAAVNIGVDSAAAFEAVCAFWGEVLGTELEDWGTPSRQVVRGPLRACLGVRTGVSSDSTRPISARLLPGRPRTIHRQTVRTCPGTH